MRRWRFMLAAALLLSGCGGHPEPSAPRPPRIGGGPAMAATAPWRQFATAHDRDRLRRVRDAWLAGLAAARTTDAAAVTAGGELFDPDHALADPLPPPGRYRCRTFKLGANGTAARRYEAYPWSECQVQQRRDATVLATLDGVQRPVGTLFQEGSTRAVFLGTLVIGDESSPLSYGADESRDVAGIVERIGERRWRLTMPFPRFQSLVDVVELVPLR